ncbi:MAG: hypothetical protein K2W96_28805 [Gemmataceae bacterium]|nr:hypothetical protein [Gemmataceae bacterium]
MPRVFLSLSADSHDAAIEYYCHTIRLLLVAVDKTFAPTVRNVVPNYVGAPIPLSLAVRVAPEKDSPEAVRRVFELALFHPNIDLAHERLAAAGYAVEAQHGKFGMVLATTDPFGNTLCLTDDTYASYDDEE